MKRFGCYAYLTLTALYALGWAVTAFAAAWMLSERLWAVTCVGAFIGIGVMFAAAMTLEELDTMPAKLPRAQRKALKEERARIQFEARIKELEKEAGL